MQIQPKNSEPIEEQTFSDWAKTTCYDKLIESISIIGVTCLLIQASQLFLYPSAPKYKKEIIACVVIAPVAEEIIFRGVFQSIFKGCQSLKNECVKRYYNREISEEDLKAQAVFRVRVMGLFFGVAHMINHDTVLEAAPQVIRATVGGVAYGYIEEKYHNLGITILAHGINNFLAMSLSVFPNHKLIWTSSIVGLHALKGFWYVFGSCDIIQQKSWTVYQGIQNGLSSLHGKCFSPVQVC